MIRTLLAIAGFTPAPPPPRPASRRHEPPTPPRPTARPTAQATSDREAKAAAAKADAQRRSDAKWAEAVRLILRASDASDSGYVEPRELDLARGRVGPEIGEYLRACRHAGIPIRRIGDAELADARRLAAYREDLTARAASDAEGWDRGHLALIESQKGARKAGREPEVDLLIPDDVANAIAKLVAERLARLSRRQGAGSAGAPGTVGTVPPPPPPPPPPAASHAETKDDNEPEEPGSAPPAGPKR